MRLCSPAAAVANDGVGHVGWEALGRYACRVARYQLMIGGQTDPALSTASGRFREHLPPKRIRHIGEVVAHGPACSGNPCRAAPGGPERTRLARAARWRRRLRGWPLGGQEGTPPRRGAQAPGHENIPLFVPLTGWHCPNARVDGGALPAIYSASGSLVAQSLRASILLVPISARPANLRVGRRRGLSPDITFASAPQRYGHSSRAGVRRHLTTEISRGRGSAGRGRRCPGTHRHG